MKDIQTAKRTNTFSATLQQEGVWFHAMQAKNGAWNKIDVAKFTGFLNYKALTYTIKNIIKKYSSFRTSFIIIDNKLFQHVSRNFNLLPYIFYFDISAFNNDERKICLQDILLHEHSKKFNLSAGPLIHFNIVQAKYNEYFIIISKHHIISDELSNQILWSEIETFYNEMVKNDSIQVNTDNQYLEYSSWQKEFNTTKNYENQLKYWKKKLSGDLPYLKFPFNYKENPSEHSSEMNIKKISFDKDMTKLIRNFALKKKVSFSSLFLSAYYILLCKYFGKDDIIIGNLINGRNTIAKRYTNSVGLFANKLALRQKISNTTTLENFLKEVNTTLKEAYHNKDIIYEDLLRKLELKTSDIFTPIFQVVFNMIKRKSQQNNMFKKTTITDLSNPLHKLNNIAGQYKLSLSVIDEKDEITLTTFFIDEYNHNVFYLNILKHYKNILLLFLEKCEKKIYEVDILSDPEKKQLIYEFNNTSTDYPKSKTIINLFEEQVRKTPGKIAIATHNFELTFYELSNKINSLASQLRKGKIKPDSVIGIMIDRKPEMLISILGVLKSGAAYLPIDPNFPIERIKYMLTDSRVEMVISQDKYISRFNLNDQIVFINANTSTLYKNSQAVDLPNINSPGDLAYVIYTSGSTGNPKGVMIEHKNVINFIYGVIRELHLTENKNILCLTTISFDIFVLETLLPLLQGITVILADESEQKEPELLKGLIEKKKIEVLQITPSRLKLLMNYENTLTLLNSVKKLLIGGETLPEELFQDLKKKYTGSIYNMYGPTETTIWSAIKNLTHENEVTIGKPMANTQLYIIDKDIKLCPIGIVGELCISGLGLARGYIHNESLTKEKFIENPFQPNSLMYKTGDLARWLPGGNIEYIGRKDFQVKIRGFRIELEEIESQLSKHELIKESVVLAKSAEGDKQLVAYYVSEKEIEFGELKSHLSQNLPNYMLPAHYVFLKNLPLTFNGKLDRKALPQPKIEAGNGFMAPSNKIEEKVAKIWSDVLNIEKQLISVDKSFFELGGHSLKAIQFISQLNNQHNLELTLKEVFNFPTIEKLGKVLSKKTCKNKRIIPKIAKRTSELASTQKRIYFLQQLLPQSTAYNIPKAYLVKGNIDVKKLEKSFIQLIKVHDILRTGVSERNGTPIQEIADDVNFSIEVIDNKTPDLENIQRYIVPFEIDKPPLFKVTLVKKNVNQNILILNTHHLISDAGSSEILFNELIKCYITSSVTIPQYQYFDYVNWLKIKEKKTYEDQRAYWLNLFKDINNPVHLPYDHIAKNDLEESGESIKLELKKDTYLKLKSLGNKTNASLYILMFAIYKIILSKFINNDDVIVGTPMDNRPYPEFENTLGLFVNTLVIRSNPADNKKFLAYLQEVKEILLKAYENRDYPFEVLVNELDIKRYPDRNPLFDTFFNYLKIERNNQLQENDIEFIPIHLKKESTKFDIRVFVQESNNDLVISFNYKSNLFKNETIEYLVTQFEKLIGEIILDDNKEIGEYDIFSIAPQYLEDMAYNILHTNNIDLVANNLSIGQLFSETLKLENKITPKVGHTDFEKSEIEQSIPSRFAKMVHKYSNKVAIKTPYSEISYYEFNKKTNDIAAILLNNRYSNSSLYNGIDNEIVILLCGHNEHMITALFVCLKAGKTYVPVDPTNPIQRIISIINDCKAKLILIDSKNKRLAEQITRHLSYNIPIINIEDVQHSLIGTNKVANIDITKKHWGEPSSVCYVLYTSGSTGKPKGVYQSHRNVLHFIRVYTNALKINSSDRMTMLSNYCFDAAVMSIYGALLNGAALCVFDIRNEDVKSLHGFINREKITIYHSTPSIYRAFLSNMENSSTCETIRLIVLGGEPVVKKDVELYKKHFSNNCIFINGLGPTESTVTLQNFINKETKISGENIPVGYPVEDTQVYILNKDDEQVGIYEEGQIVYQSDFLALGYLNDVEKTQYSFPLNLIEEGKRYYKSGDIGRRLPNGMIEFIGRRDNQYKIRGIRVEMGEIENQLLNIEYIKQAKVLVHNLDENDSILIAFIVSSMDNKKTFNIKKRLRQILPNYMVPSHIIYVDSIPLNQNGKIDKYKLLEGLNSLRKTTNKKNLPELEIEKEMASLWKNLLKVDTVCLDDNFFDLGGHSFRLFELISLIKERFKVELSINSFFNQNLKQISKLIIKKSNSLNK